ncbi:MAG TPA: response regulator [Verrucomicrobiae bacterium]|nr:response regulator [Verrucomicrobiae bacterium]
MDDTQPFNLPTDIGTEPAATSSQGGDIDLSSVTILLVEDDKILQELYYERFVQAGFTVVQAFDGLQALDKLETHPEIKLVLLDLMLPRLSGYDVLAHVKQDATTRNIPVIIVSALADVDDQARGLQLGAAEYITKGEMLPAAVIEKIKQYVLSVPRTLPAATPSNDGIQRPTAE